MKYDILDARRDKYGATGFAQAEIEHIPGLPDVVQHEEHASPPESGAQQPLELIYSLGFGRFNPERVCPNAQLRKHIGRQADGDP